MTIHALITGELHRDPVQRTSQTGRTFVTANLKVQDGSETLWASCIAFSEDAMAELLRLRAGDAVSIQGKLKVSVFEKAGEHRPSLDITASSVQALRPKPRPRQPRQAQQAQASREFDPRQVYNRPAPAHPAEGGFDDPVPF